MIQELVEPTLQPQDDRLVLVAGYEDSDTQFYKFMNGDVLIGHVQLHRMKIDELERGHISNLSILPEFQRQKHGRGLVKQITEIAKQQFQIIDLLVSSNNKIAIFLYGLVGFRIVSQPPSKFFVDTGKEYVYTVRMRIDQTSQVPVIYTDGSCRHLVGWAWCMEDGRHGSGFDSKYQCSMSAEMLSVIHALKSIDYPEIEIINDNATVVTNINGMAGKACIEIKYPELWAEYNKYAAGRSIYVRYPHQKEKKIFHNWCDHAAHRRSPKKENVLEFETWWKKHTEGMTPTEESKYLAMDAWFALLSKSNKPSKPPICQTS